MRRREILAALAAAAVPWPLRSLGQQFEPLRNIGVLMGLAESDPEVPPRIAVFQQALQQLGWAEGRNIRIHYRWDVEPDRMRTVAKELVTLQPDVIVASSSLVVDALLRETRTTPIVFVTAADPVGDGFVTSLAQPIGNATGFTNNLSSIGGKWLELLKEIAPDIAHVAVLFNPETAPSGGSYFLPPLQAAAVSLAVRLNAAPARDPAEIEGILAALGREVGGGLVVMPDNFTSVHRGLIVSLATRYRVPAIYPSRYFATAGGLVSYGADLLDLYRRVASYVDRILKGARPADLPVQSPGKIELVINLKIAKALGLTVPRLMLARADEVIE
jgi:putative tryptophan/tyrosine transport system substrate-binding protein